MGSNILTHEPVGGLVFSESPQRIGANSHKSLINANLAHTGVFRKRAGWEDLGLAVDDGTSIDRDRVHSVGHLGDELLLWANDRLYSYDEVTRTWSDRGPWSIRDSDLLRVHDTPPDQTQVSSARFGRTRVTTWRQESEYRVGVADAVTGRYRTALGTAFGDAAATRMVVTGHDPSPGGVQFVSHGIVVQGTSTGEILISPIVEGADLPYATSTISGRVTATYGSVTTTVFDVQAYGRDLYIFSQDSTTNIVEVHRVREQSLAAFPVHMLTLGFAAHLLTGVQFGSGRWYLAAVNGATPDRFASILLSANDVIINSATILPPTSVTIQLLATQLAPPPIPTDPEPDVVLAVRFEANPSAVTPNVDMLQFYRLDAVVGGGPVIDTFTATSLVATGWQATVESASETVWPMLVNTGTASSMVLWASGTGELLGVAGSLGAVAPDDLVPPLAPVAVDADGTVEVPYSQRSTGFEGTTSTTFGASSPTLLQLTHREDCVHPQEIAGTVAWPSAGVMRIYDGSRVAEQQFLHGHEVIEFTSIAFPSAIGAGDYVYALTWAWQDVSGRTYRGAPTFLDPITVGAAESPQIIVGALVSERTDAVLEVWRSLDGQSSPLHLTSSRVNPPLAAGNASGVVVFVDPNTDVDIVGNEQLDEATLPDVVTPVANWCAIAGDRLWSRSLDDPRTMHASKTAVEGVGMQMSRFITVVAPEDGTRDEVRGVSKQDQNFFGLTATACFAFAGEGVDNSGAGSPFALPVPVPVADGHQLRGGVVLTPAGVLWASSDGLGVIGRGQEIGGAAAELVTDAYRAQGYSIRQISYDPRSQEICLLDDGRGGALAQTPGQPPPSTLAFDAHTRRWTALPVQLLARSLSATGSDRVLVTAGAARGIVLRERDADDEDHTVAGTRQPLRIRTGWLTAGRLGADPLAISSAMLTMNYRSAHLLEVTVRCNYDEAVVARYRIDPDAPIRDGGVDLGGGAVTLASTWGGGTEWGGQDDPAWGGSRPGVPGLAQYQVLLDSLPSPCWAIDFDIVDTSGTGGCYDLTAIEVSVDKSKAQGSLAPMIAARRVGPVLRQLRR